MKFNTDPPSKWVAVYRVVVLLILTINLVLHVLAGHDLGDTTSWWPTWLVPEAPMRQPDPPIPAH